MPNGGGIGKGCPIGPNVTVGFLSQSRRSALLASLLLMLCCSVSDHRPSYDVALEATHMAIRKRCRFWPMDWKNPEVIDGRGT